MIEMLSDFVMPMLPVASLEDAFLNTTAIQRVDSHPAIEDTWVWDSKVAKPTFASSGPDHLPRKPLAMKVRARNPVELIALRVSYAKRRDE